MTEGRGTLRGMAREIRRNRRFFLAVGVAALAALAHYDVPFGGYWGDRIVILSLITLPLFAFRGVS